MFRLICENTRKYLPDQIGFSLRKYFCILSPALSCYILYCSYVLVESSLIYLNS